MRRREFIGAGVMASLWPFPSGAQQQPRPVIGVLGSNSPEVKQIQLEQAAFREGLAEAGFIENQNVAIEYRWAEQRIDRLPALAAELVQRKVDVIVTQGGRDDARREERDLDNPDPLPRVQRPGRAGLGRQLRSPGWQPHGRQVAGRGADSQATRPAAGTGATGQGRRRAPRPEQSAGSERGSRRDRRTAGDFARSDRKRSGRGVRGASRTTSREGPALAAKEATSTIPIICILSRDPVAAGFADSLQRPRRNVTGVTLHGLDVQRLEIVSELLPQAKVIGYLVNPKDPSAGDAVKSAQQAAQAKTLQLEVIEASNENDIEPAFAKAKQSRADAIIVLGNVLFSGRASQLAGLAAQHKVPAIFPGRVYVENGGLLSYGPDLFPAYQSNGTYAARILKGEKAADLPFQRPMKLTLVVNMNAANALGLAVPQSMLARADTVIK